MADEDNSVDNFSAYPSNNLISKNLQKKRKETFTSGAAIEVSLIREKLVSSTSLLVSGFEHLKQSFFTGNTSHDGHLQEWVKITTVNGIFNRMSELLSSFQYQIGSLSDNPFDRLPSEILSMIFSFIPTIKQLGQLARVCKRFNRKLFEDQNLWKNVCTQWWNERNFDIHVNLETVVHECQKVDDVEKRDWTWFAKCFARGNKEDGPSWRELHQQNYTEIFPKSQTNQRPVGLLIGNMRGKELHGWGIVIDLSGSQQRMGHFTNGKLNGRGYSIWRVGERYVGEWENDQRTGHGVYTWPTGDVYEGAFRNGEREGKGTYVWADGVKFEGDYKKNVKDGKGVYVWPNGNTYEGELKKNQRNGWGSMTWNKTGFKYEGLWANNEPAEDLSLHPAIRELVNIGICTSVVTGSSRDYGQFLFDCETCGFSYCHACWRRCHKDESERRVVKKWYPGSFCACAENLKCLCKPLSIQEDHEREEQGQQDGDNANQGTDNSQNEGGGSPGSKTPPPKKQKHAQ